MKTTMLELGEETLLECFGKRAFSLRHSLVSHPLFQLDRLVQLAGELPLNKVEWNAGTMPLVTDPNAMPGNGLSAAETIERIAECGSWLVLKHVQLNPEYGELLRAAVDEFRPALESRGHRLFRIQGFIFVSSPGAVTPLHIDPEQNFLLQIRGSKTLSVGDRQDKTLVADEEREAFAAGGHRNLRVDDERLAAARPIQLLPGDAIHVPMHAPHFVQNGPDVSVSFSVTFQTQVSDAEHGVLWINHQLRRAGLRPSPLGRSPASDRFKHTAFRGLRALKRLARR